MAKLLTGLYHWEKIASPDSLRKGRKGRQGERMTELNSRKNHSATRPQTKGRVKILVRFHDVDGLQCKGEAAEILTANYSKYAK
jgi:hypothetical protein